MKLHSVDRTKLSTHSFTIRKNNYSNFLKIWHYHPELELVYILQSEGTRFIGDSIQQFKKGDLVLIGKNLPHLWLNENKYFAPKSKLKAEAISIHFKEDFLGNSFSQIPEMKNISTLLDASKHGIQFTDVSTKTVNTIKALTNKKGVDKFISLLIILDLLAKSV